MSKKSEVAATVWSNNISLESRSTIFCLENRVSKSPIKRIKIKYKKYIPKSSKNKFNELFFDQAGKEIALVSLSVSRSFSISAFF